MSTLVPSSDDAAPPGDAERRLRALGISAASIAAWRTRAEREGDGRSFDEAMAGIPDDWIEVVDEIRRTGIQLAPWRVWEASGEARRDDTT